MSFLEDIKKEIENKKPTKAELLLKFETEINLMMENNIPLTKQVELILKNKILEKIDMSEYKKIVKKHFNYKPKFTRKNKIVATPVTKPKPKSNSAAKSAKEILSQEINLLQ